MLKGKFLCAEHASSMVPNEASNNIIVTIILVRFDFKVSEAIEVCSFPVGTNMFVTYVHMHI